MAPATVPMTGWEGVVKGGTIRFTAFIRVASPATVPGDSGQGKAPLPSVQAQDAERNLRAAEQPDLFEGMGRRNLDLGQVSGEIVKIPQR